MYAVNTSFVSSSHYASQIQYIGQMARYLLAQPMRDDDAHCSVRLAIGNGMRADVWREFQGRFSVGRICEFYGSTEGNANLINTESVVGAVSCGC